MSIHTTAVIDPKAVIGKNASIGPFAFIDESVEIGDNAVIGSHVTILRHTKIGEGVRVHAGVVLGDLPQDLGFSGEPSYVKIGQRCTFREFVTIHRGTKPGTVTEVGDDCFLMANVHIAHNSKVGNRVIIANGTMLGGYVEIGDRAFVSGNVLIHQFVKIGRVAMVGGAAGLSKDVPPFCLVQGMGRNVVQGLNIVGTRRAGISPEERKQIKAAFKLLYLSGFNVTQAVEKLKASFPSGPAAEFAAFVEQSQRGLCRYGGSRTGNTDDE
ncbi:MAG: acyl-ACP--UDP-N-acetylglucosamine O-acyltransferase [Syntrophus sp. (in: bacteria)]